MWNLTWVGRQWEPTPRGQLFPGLRVCSPCSLDLPPEAGPLGKYKRVMFYQKQKQSLTALAALPWNGLAFQRCPSWFFRALQLGGSSLTLGLSGCWSTCPWWKGPTFPNTGCFFGTRGCVRNTGGFPGTGEGYGGQMLKTRSHPERVRPSSRQGVPGRPDSLRGPGCECQNDLKQ